jgi:hypothetical protein
MQNPKYGFARAEIALDERVGKRPGGQLGRGCAGPGRRSAGFDDPAQGLGSFLNAQRFRAGVVAQVPLEDLKQVAELGVLLVVGKRATGGISDHA